MKTNGIARWLLVLLWPVALFAADAAPEPRRVALRVDVGADGRVQSARPDGVTESPAIERAASEIAYKLTFAPARKDGLPVPSQTTLYLDLGFVPRGGGQFGVRLVAASNGPSVRRLGAIHLPGSVPKSARGGSASISVRLTAEGEVVPDSVQAERMDLRVPSTVVEGRYLAAISSALKRSRFQTDIIDGAAVAERVSLPFQFGAGEVTRDASGQPHADAPGRSSGANEAPVMPVWRAESSEAGIELARVLVPAGKP